MRADEIHLSYTDPMTGQAPRHKRYREVQYVDIDGVVLVVHHYHRSRAPQWTAKPYMDHLSAEAYAAWVQHLSTQPGSGLVFAHIRRRDLLGQIAKEIGNEEWKRGRDAWLALPRDPQWSGPPYRVVRRAPKEWWGVPSDPTRHQPSGPWHSERAARAALGVQAA
ncbi:hypothetical protein AB0I84_21170 [Streptomyces spectabilis]|uniref:hypothetical protein n=1 Tax=Streptomyces spectabilis TaxID=68270 RepID=UPI0033E7AB89